VVEGWLAFWDMSCLCKHVGKHEVLSMQVQSNALAALEALDCDVAEQILSSGCVTGDRINGLCDGETGKW